MLRLAEIYLNDDAAEQFTKKLQVYNNLHPDDKLSYKEFSKELLELAIKFIDISALD